MKPGLEAQAHPTIRDIAWAAGLYEGEGSCVARTCSASIAQKDRWVLERMKLLFGGTIHEHRTPKYESFFSWRVNGTRARGFVMTIYVLLSPRRQEQVRALLAVEAKRIAHPLL
jgi:hypothetical protein